MLVSGVGSFFNCTLGFSEWQGISPTGDFLTLLIIKQKQNPAWKGPKNSPRLINESSYRRINTVNSADHFATVEYFGLLSPYTSAMRKWISLAFASS